MRRLTILALMVALFPAGHHPAGQRCAHYTFADLDPNRPDCYTSRPGWDTEGTR